ncbi:hypothetical protein BIZ83_gp116 [Erwinia phage vB_EamM_ChrisDB]|uniref:hypothetical protein n=1 Tax=Erwinia phage vB_EamM_ChrisDB TaxID=1883371 RepID=UPI00081C320F|nr:hypothetical protein BIZ83_gp116 [Erwinia phage vB_EamM_ChrisDB]ANZ48737.1 hypothetical protein CHRISDB_175 [Erwinia phage vB_EamM_ChrisDB]
MAIVSAQTQLVALFNAKNTGLAQALAVADVDFGAVAVYTPGDGGDTRNSKLTITAKAGSEHFSGEKELHYTRLAGAGLVGNKALTEDQADWDTDEEVLAKFNADVIAAGKTEDAFVESELTFTRTDGQDGAKVITVAIKAGHIKFIEGDAAVYTITQEVVKTDLSTTNGELDGFTTS